MGDARVWVSRSGQVSTIRLKVSTVMILLRYILYTAELLTVHTIYGGDVNGTYYIWRRC